MKYPVLLAAFLAAVVALSGRPKESLEAHRAPLLPKPQWLRVLGAPYLNVLSDYYWIQTTHQTGEAATPDDYRDIYDYARMATELDPMFRQVYIFASVIIPFNPGNDKWINTAESTDLLERAFARFPADVYIRILLAYNISAFQHDYLKAARMLEETSRLPGAPPYLPQLATRFYAQGGDVQSGLLLAQSLESSSGDPATKEVFSRRIKELKLEEELQDVDRAAKAYQERTGAPPSDVEALVREGDLKAMPVDPLQGNIYLGKDGRAHSTSVGRRLESY